jgi:hypothetical protein
MPFERMEQEAGPSYQFKLLGSVYVYSSQTWYYRAMTAAVAVWILGVILVVLNEYLGGIIAFAGFVLLFYVLESGYRRGKALS